MADFTDGIDFTADAPFVKVIRQAKVKLTKRVDGYPSKSLLEWADQRGGLEVFAFAGDDPRIMVPEPHQCPAILIWLASSPEVEGVYNSTAAREFFLTLRFEGFLYTADQEEIAQFAWLFLGAISKPWMKNGFDEFAGPTKVAELDYYWPSSPLDFEAWGRNADEPEIFSFRQDITFRMSQDLFR